MVFVILVNWYCLLLGSDESVCLYTHVHMLVGIMYICIYACMYVCMCVCVCACMHVCLCMLACVCWACKDLHPGTILCF